MARIAFYAPIKPPDHPIPSGDRLIAGNLIKALTLAGHKVDLASRYIAYSKRSALEILAARKAGALEEAAAVIARLDGLDVDLRPNLWMTYHPYCKAPDWIGPMVTDHFGIPLVTVEAARTLQGENDEWGPWRREAQEGIRAADLHLVFKPSDRAYLIELLGSADRLQPLAPFIDAEAMEQANAMPLPAQWDAQVPVMITAGMMRKGKKDRNFTLLAELLTDLQDIPWNLVLIGGGPEEEAVRQAFSGIDPARLCWSGQVPHSDVLRWMSAGDLFVWPGWKEPIGMVYLEAQTQGLPVAAFDSLGVALVVGHEKTGLLAPEGDNEQFRANLRRMLTDTDFRAKMAANTRETVLKNHSMQAAARQLNHYLNALLAGYRTPV